MKKIYKIEHRDSGWQIEVEIDHEIADPRIVEMVTFWSEWEDWLEENKGNYTKAFLRKLAADIYGSVAYNGNNITEVVSDLRKLEGYYPLNVPKTGVFITHIDPSFLNKRDFEVEEV